MKSRSRAAAAAAVLTIAAAVSGCGTSSDSSLAMPARAAAAFAEGPQAATRALALKDLAGLKPADVVSILGQPDLKRDEPPAELWQYRAADCVLNLFFYDDAGGYRLAHVEAWQRTLTGDSMPARCHDEDAPIKAHLVSRAAF